MLHILFINIFFFLLLTIIIATITVIERKVLALLQRRVGPNYIGYRGRFQFIADALKLLTKHIFILIRLNKIMFLIVPCLVLVLCYLLWVNLVWGPNINLFEIEYNFILMQLLSGLFSILLFVVGITTKNKYAILSSYRVLVMTLNLEIFINFLVIMVVMLFESFSFHQVIVFQNNLICGFFLFLPSLPIFIITFLLETGRIPFDLAEAESELVAGYTTELGGFFFTLFYLGEYFHLYCFAVIYSILLFSF